MKYHDIQEKQVELSPTTRGSKYYPTVGLNTKQVPELDHFKVGEDIELVFKGTVKAMRVEEKGTQITVELKSCGVGDSKQPDMKEKTVEQNLKDASHETIEELKDEKQPPKKRAKRRNLLMED